MTRSFFFALFTVTLLASGLAYADVISLKDGNVMECKVLQQTVKNNKPVMIVELEGGKKQTIQIDNIAWIAKAKPSWEVRKEEKAWYTKEVEKKAKKLEGKWKEHERLGKTCKRKRYLDDEAAKHFEMAYELRKPEIKDTIKDHEKVAGWLERTCGMFSLAAKEWTWSFDRQLKEVEARDPVKDSHYMKLGKWAEKKSLYDKAKLCFEKALEINPKSKTAKAGIERIKRLQNTLVNPKLFRSIKTQHARAVQAFQKKQGSDGTFGSDIKVAGVQGLRAETALCCIALMGQWEFAMVDDASAGSKPPSELIKGIDYLMACETAPKKLRGPDVFGNIYTIQLLVRILKNQNLKRYHEKAKKRMNDCLSALASMQGNHGGWAYYNHNKGNENSFLGSALLIVLAEAKEMKLQVNDQVFSRGLQHLKSTKQQDGVWMYKSGARQSVQGSQGRAAGCELALLLCGQGSPQALQLSVDNFFKYRNILEAVKGKKGTHMGSGGTAPYYYLWGHMYLSMAIKRLDASARDKYMVKLRDLFLKDQESDGGFTDCPLFKSYKISGAAQGAITLYNIGTIYKKPAGGARR